MKKIVIKKGSVMETLIIPLYGKKKANELYPDLFVDESCKDVFEKIVIHMDEPKKMKMKVGAIMAGTRQFDLAQVCRDYLKTHPEASVVNLGCGLDNTFNLLSAEDAQGYNIDFPDVINARNKLLEKSFNETNIACDLMDFNWMDKIDFSEDKGAIFFASGLFYYFKREDVKKLFAEMAQRFPGGKLVFDATNEKGLKKMLKTWLKPSEMGNVALYFCLEDEQEILTWSDKIKSVVKKGYMTGYRPLDKRFGFAINALFRYAEKANMSQIIEIEFKG